MRKMHAQLTILAFAGSSLGMAQPADAGHIALGIGFGLPGVAVVAASPYYYAPYHAPAYVVPPYYGYAYDGRAYRWYTPRYDHVYTHGHGHGHGQGRR